MALNSPRLGGCEVSVTVAYPMLGLLIVLVGVCIHVYLCVVASEFGELDLPKSDSKALTWYKRSAAQKFPASQFRAGLLVEAGAISLLHVLILSYNFCFSLFFMIDQNPGLLSP